MATPENQMIPHRNQHLVDMEATDYYGLKVKA